MFFTLPNGLVRDADQRLSHPVLTSAAVRHGTVIRITEGYATFVTRFSAGPDYARHVPAGKQHLRGFSQAIRPFLALDKVEAVS